MRLLPLVTLTFCLSQGAAFVPPSLAQIPSYPANATFFTGDPPSLVTAGTPDNVVNWPSARYYFTFNVPKTSPQSLGKVTITQEPSPQAIVFVPDKTEAFAGDKKNKGQKIALQSVVIDPQSQGITVTFATPIPPGTTFTVVLQNVQNPSIDGVYLFRIQAFPAGTEPVGLDLGVGRFSFYRPF